MRYLLLSVLVVCVIVSFAVTQVFALPGDLVWDKNRPLTWDDFQGVPGTFYEGTYFVVSSDEVGAYSMVGISYDLLMSESNNMPCEYKITKTSAFAYFHKPQSWVADAMFTKWTESDRVQLLKHEQGHFDLAHIVAQEFNAEFKGKTFACPSGVYDVDEIHKELGGFTGKSQEYYNILVRAYEDETYAGLYSGAQAGWDKRIASMLNDAGVVMPTTPSSTTPPPTTTPDSDLDINKQYTREEVLAMQEEKLESMGCLIATAAFGSEMSPQVQLLREIRNNTVLQTESGSAFMTGFNQFYYSFSPAIADYERENPAFKEAVKIALTPLLASLTLLQYADIDSESEMLGYGIGIIMLNIGMYLLAPAVVTLKLVKKYRKINF